MPRDARTITPADILPLDQYELIRADKKAEALARKQLTRIAVGPHATVLFENRDSMWLQIQEMLRIEKGELDLTSVNAAPFGCGAILSMEPYEALDAWIKRGGLGEL